MRLEKRMRLLGMLTSADDRPLKQSSGGPSSRAFYGRGTHFDEITKYLANSGKFLLCEHALVVFA